MTDDRHTLAQDEYLREQIQKMKDDEVMNFVRETVTRLDALADRLERLVEKGEGERA